MKKAKPWISSVAALLLLPAATLLAQDEADDAPPPAVEVFEVQAVPLGAAIARPFAVPPTFASGAPHAVSPDGTLVPDDSDAVDRVRVQLNDGSQLIGEIDAKTPLAIRAKFGEVDVTFEDVARIEGAVDDGNWRVTFANGDRVTGELKLAGIELKTSWGELRLDEEKIASLEIGKLHSHQVAVARTSPDGRTTSVAYRQRQVFVPLLPEATVGGVGFQPTTYGVPTTIYPVPRYPVPATLVPSTRPIAPE